MFDDSGAVGKRLQEIRALRGMTLREVADLSGCVSAATLSRMENGLSSSDSRTKLAGLANALEVSLSDILGRPLPARDPISRDAHSAIERIGVVLAHNRLGHPYQEQPYHWPILEATLRRFTETLVPSCDYTGQAQVLPDLIEQLYTVHATDPGHRRDALTNLMIVLQHTAALLKNLGAHGMPYMAAMQMRYVADELDDPAWRGVAEWRVGQSSGGDRPRQLAVSVRAAEQAQGSADPRVRHAYGMLHLNAAFACAVMRKADDAHSHLAEAQEMVTVTEGTDDFGDMHFNAANVGVWRVAVGVELGDGPKVAELANRVDVSLLPAAERRGMFYGDVARGLAQSKHTRAQAVSMLRTAEKEAPQRVRTNPFIRETVSDLLRRSKRDASGREIRGLAYRMGIAV